MSNRTDQTASLALHMVALVLAIVPAAWAEPPAGPAATPPPAAAAPTLPDPPIPTQHAIQAGMGRCTSAVDQLSRMALNMPYNAQSTWNQTAPADHVFQSVAGVMNAHNNPPGGLVAIVAAPVPGETCDAVAMEVYPLAGSCDDMQRLLTRSGTVETALEGIKVLADAQKRRVFLMPGASNTCVAVSVKSFYGNK